MYLDDGVSRDSAPIDLPQHKYKDAAQYTKAKGFYREVKFTQVQTLLALSLLPQTNRAPGKHQDKP